MKLAFAFLFLLPIFAPAAVNTGRPTDTTPYDPYMQPVHTVLRRAGTKPAAPVKVREHLKTAYGFRYQHKNAYVAQTPAVTEQRRTGDCKDKALWLCQQMGTKGVRFVIGKAHTNSKLNHAWLAWQSEGKTWILDPTNSGEPIAADSVGSDQYQPLYSFSRGGKFSHGSASSEAVAQADRR